MQQKNQLINATNYSAEGEARSLCSHPRKGEHSGEAISCINLLWFSRSSWWSKWTAALCKTIHSQAFKSPWQPTHTHTHTQQYKKITPPHSTIQIMNYWLLGLMWKACLQKALHIKCNRITKEDIKFKVEQYIFIYIYKYTKLSDASIKMRSAEPDEEITWFNGALGEV